MRTDSPDRSQPTMNMKKENGNMKVPARRSLARRQCRVGALFAAIALITMAVAAVPANAAFEIEEFSTRFLDAAGATATQAGSHPDIQTTILFTEAPYIRGGEAPEQQMREVVVDLPAGFYGDPTAAPTCRREVFVSAQVPPACPPESQVGTLLSVPAGETQESMEETLGPFFPAYEWPVYNIETLPGETAVLAANVIGVPVSLQVTPRTDGDYGLEATLKNIDPHLNLHGSVLTLWGEPSSPAHDALREIGPFEWGPLAGSQARPFVTMPARCGEPLGSALKVRTWDEPTHWLTALDAAPPATGCELLEFHPSIGVQPVSTKAGVPSGYDVYLHVPQDTGAESISTPQLRDAVVTLPEGVSISPPSASGLETCDDAQTKLGTREEPTCPDGSKIGTVTLDTPLLKEPLSGEIDLRTPEPGELFRLLLVARGSGMVIKVPGIAKPDPVTGQLTTTFKDSPQLPFTELHLHFKGGPRAPLTNPTTCGAKTVTTRMTSWGGQSASPSSTFNIDGCGASKFKPSAEAGVVDPAAGSSSAFVLRVQRGEDENELKTVRTVLPQGLLAKIAGVPPCADGQAVTGACPEASKIGSVTVGAGAGSAPYYVTGGKTYLTQGYKGAPYGLLFSVPAVAGPFDLGTVNVRAALRIDPVTTQVSVEADPMPRILEGVPLEIRDLRVSIDRSDFVQTPTNCSEMEVGATLGSYAGDSIDVPTRFQVGDCANLEFAPKLAFRFWGKTHRAAHPKMQAVLTMPPGANMKSTSVVLPKTELLENAHIREVCTRAQYAANACPEGSIYGYAKVWTPLLDQPLQGPVYLRSNGGERTLPDLVASLDGQIHVDLVGYIDSVHRRIRTRFLNVPDAPVSRFVLTMKGGDHGLLANNTQLCKKAPVASVFTEGHNGKTSAFKARVRTGCGGKKKARRHAHNR